MGSEGQMVEKIIVKGGNTLTGNVRVEGAKMPYYLYWRLHYLRQKEKILLKMCQIWPMCIQLMKY